MASLGASSLMRQDALSLPLIFSGDQVPKGSRLPKYLLSVPPKRRVQTAHEGTLMTKCAAGRGVPVGQRTV